MCEIKEGSLMIIFIKECKLLLVVESSCDEISVVVIEDGDKIFFNIVVL